VTESEGERPLSEAAEALDDHGRRLITDLTDFKVEKPKGKKPRSCMFTILWSGLVLAATFGLLYVLSDRLDLLSGEFEPLDASGTESTVTEQASTTSTAGTAILDSSDANNLKGTWAMYWTNANGSENQAFTIRFDGGDKGTLEILNDDTEFDTTFRFDGDRVWFTFTRIFDIEISDSQTIKWPEIRIFEGSFHGLDEISGEWAREDWDCVPDRDTPCKYHEDAVGDPARLVRE
jgi:hypothetical protein